MKRLNRISCHIISFVFTLCLGVQTLQASTTRIGFEDAIFPELAVSGRALALGGAYMAKVDDSSAPFYNPAGLGTVRGVKFHLSNLHFETNMGWMKVATGGKIADAITNIPTALTMEGQRQKLNSDPDNTTSTRYQFVPNMTGRFFSAGALISRKTRMRVRTYSSAVTYCSKKCVEYVDRTDYGFYGSMNLSLFGGVIKGGATATYLTRSEADSTADATTALNLTESNYKKGSTMVLTVGAKLTLPVAWLPIFSATMHNATGKAFETTRSQGPPDPIKTSIDAGFAVTPKIGSKTWMSIEVNYKDVTGQHKAGGEPVPVIRKVLVGVELDFARSFFLRFGYGDSYGSAGLGFKSKSVDFDLSTYSVNPEPSSTKIRGDEDRRISLSISTGLGF